MERLTEPEREIAKLLARGLTHTEIAKRLSLIPAAVSFYRQIINRKLGIHTREELFQFV
jgi:DNA-binding NarL/FixJ family response regulator